MGIFKSGIILKDSIELTRGGDEDYYKLLSELHIVDADSYVKARLVPQNDEWWVDPDKHPEKWIFAVEQDETPDWFEPEKYEAAFRSAVCVWWNQHVLIDQKIDELDTGYYHLKGCEVKKLRNNAEVVCYDTNIQTAEGNVIIHRLSGTSTVIRLCESAGIRIMEDKSAVHEMFDSTTIERMNDQSTVTKMYATSHILNMYELATVGMMWNKSIIHAMYDSAAVQAMWGNSTIQEMHQDAKVNRMRDHSLIVAMYGQAIVEEMWSKAVVDCMKDKTMVYEMRENSIVYSLQGNAVIQRMLNSAMVGAMLHNTVVWDMWGNSVIQRMLDHAKVQNMWDSAAVQEMLENSSVLIMRTNSKVYIMKGDSVIHDQQDNAAVLEVKDNAKVARTVKVLQSEADIHKSETPIELYVVNIAKSSEENLEGEWISLPQDEKDLKQVLDRLSENDKNQLVTHDVSTREDCTYIRDMIREWDNIYEINVIAHMIGNEPHPAVEAYIEDNADLSLAEVANLFVQETKIPYFPYEFKGSDDPEVMQTLLDEEKMGYTFIETNPDLKHILDTVNVGTNTFSKYIDVEAIGRDMQTSDYVSLYENGYYDKGVEGPNLSLHTMEEIKEQLRQSDLRQEQQTESVENVPEEVIEKKAPVSKPVKQPVPKAPSL